MTSTPTILFADDDELTRETFKLFFSKAGWRCDMASDGEAALSATKSKDYDVIITDLMMPGLTGLDLLKAIRTSKPSQAVIVVTGLGDTKDAIECLKAGALDIIQKPVDFSSLNLAISRIISSIQKEESENRIYSYLESQESIFVFTSRELVELKPHIPIVETLYRAGLVDLNSKLKIDLAFQEALANSVEHGNLELDSKWKENLKENGIDLYSEVKDKRLADPAYSERKITIRTSYSKNKIEVTINDEGRGFTYDSNTRNDSLACYGRGLAIIYGSMDEVRYSKSGTELTMVKYHDSAVPAESERRFR